MHAAAARVARLWRRPPAASGAAMGCLGAWGGRCVWAVATLVLPTQAGTMWNSSDRFHLDGCGSACSWPARGGCSSATSSAPGHVGLRPRADEGAASGTQGCSLWHMEYMGYIASGTWG